MTTACGLAYVDTGGPGPAVLFVHGVGAAGYAWRPQVDALSDRLRCLTFDNRGTGGSRPAAGRDTDPDALAAELAGVFGRDLADPPAVVSRQMKAMRAFNATPYFGELAGRSTLVVSADHDPIAPPSLGRALSDGIPGSRFVELADASHGATAYRPDAVNALLVAHLTG